MTQICDGCKFAIWRRTEKGRLHPSKDGECDYLKQHPLNMVVPSAFYWLHNPPNPSGGWIKRGVEMEKTCEFFEGPFNQEPSK